MGAIQKDVQEAIQDDREIIVKQERDTRIEEIAAENQKRMEAELGEPDAEKEPEEVEETEVEETEVAEETPDDVEDDVDEPEEVEVEDDEPEDEPEEELVKIVVDGEEKEVPLSKILDAGKRTLQKDSTADKRLEEATRLWREAKEQPSPDVALKEQIPDELDLARNEYVKAQQYGTEDEVLAAFIKYEDVKAAKAQQSVAPQPDIRMVVAEQLTTHDIVNRFKRSPEDGGYSDLTDVPYLGQAVFNRVNEKMAKGLNGNDWNTYKEAGDEIRSELEAQFGTKEEKTVKDKKDKKRKLDTVKTVTKKTKAPPKDKPETTLSIIDDMKKARGQGV